MTLSDTTPRRPRNVPEETPEPEGDMDSPDVEPELDTDLDFDHEEASVIPDDDDRVVQMPI